MAEEFTLADLSEKTGIQSRTIRSYIQQDLLRGPEIGGRGARYTAYHLQRLQAIRALKDLRGLPLAEVRRRLLSTTGAEMAALAKESEASSEADTPTETGSALGYLRSLKRGVPQDPAAVPDPKAPTPLDLLLARLDQIAGKATPPARRSRGEVWTSIPVTQDVDIRVRGTLTDQQVSRWERVADHLRELLMGEAKEE